MQHDPKKLNGLRGAIHDLADEYDAQKNPEFADTLRTVSNDPAMLSKFADLLVHYDTPAAAAQAMQTEGERRIGKHPALGAPYGGSAGADLSGRHFAIGGAFAGGSVDG